MNELAYALTEDDHAKLHRAYCLVEVMADLTNAASLNQREINLKTESLALVFDLLQEQLLIEYKPIKSTV